MPTLTLLQLLFYSWQSLSFFYFLEDMYFLFKITFYHLVKQYIVLVKNENITDKSKMPLDFSLYRSSMATPSPLGSLCVCTHMPIHWSRCCQWPAPSLRPSLFWTTPTRLPNASTCISLPERFLCGHWCLLCPWAWQISPGQLSNSDWQEQVGTCPSSLTCWVGSWPPRTPSGTELQVPTGLNGLLTHLHRLPSLSSLASPLSY